jgi:hypothetical protein
MNFVGGTLAVRTFFEELAKDRLLVSPYTDKWIKTNYKKSKPILNVDNGEIIFIDASRFYGERLAKLLKIFPKFSSGFSTEYTTTNTDFWHSPNSVDKYYCQNLNVRNANAKSQIHS